jgi:hypothetical protein
MLRYSPQRTTQAKKDEIKVVTQVNGELGSPKGIEFTAYLDQDVNVDVAGEPVTPAQPTPMAHPSRSRRARVDSTRQRVKLAAGGMDRVSDAS